jgi:hypothetical protein
MAYRMSWVFVASLGLVSIVLATDETFARGGAAVHGAGAGFHSTHSPSRSLAARSFRHHRRTIGGVFWPDAEGYYGPSGGEAGAEGAPPTSRDAHITYTYDVPWDWAHRFPPAVAPSDRPYVPGCNTEAVAVPGRGGKEETVNVTRCY